MLAVDMQLDHITLPRDPTSYEGLAKYIWHIWQLLMMQNNISLM